MAERDILFGALAHQLGFITGSQYEKIHSRLDNAQPKQVWNLEKSVTQESESWSREEFVEKGLLTQAKIGVLDDYLDRILSKHKGNAGTCLQNILTNWAKEAVSEHEPDCSAETGRNGELAPQSCPKMDRYELEKLHAFGGLGQVWIARDRSLNREVALKKVKGEHAADPKVWSRFAKEAQITGQLEHPGIIPVYEFFTGQDARQSFYTMRFIYGKTFSDAIRAYHQKHHGHSGCFGNLEFRELLRVYVSVCNTLAYAHSRKVVHRDLKPANIMVGDYGEAIVLDWGIAKVLGTDGDQSVHVNPSWNNLSDPISHLLTPPHLSTIDDLIHPRPHSGDSSPTPSSLDETIPGQVMGTPAYMAPEQAAGQIDSISAASDIYSLGAILYEILTGYPPYHGMKPHEVVQLARYRSPMAPRALLPQIPPALEAICSKAMRRNSKDRYGDAKELANDIQCWLADEPVSTYREPWRHRARRWARKHRLLVSSMASAAAVALVALLGVLVLVNHQKQTLASKNQELESANVSLAQARDRANNHYQLALESVDNYFNKTSSDIELKNANFFRLRKRLLEAAVPFWQRIALVEGHTPDQEFDRSRAFFALALLRTEIGELQAALGNYQEMEPIIVKLVKDHPGEGKYRQYLGSLYNNRATLNRDLRKRDLVRPDYEKSLAIREKLVADFPDESIYASDYMANLNNLGIFFAENQDFQSARGYYLKVQDFFSKLPPAITETKAVLEAYANSYHNLAFSENEMGRHELGLQAYEQSLKRRKQLVERKDVEPKDQFQLAQTHNNLAIVHSRFFDRPAVARQHYEASFPVVEKLVEDFPSVPAYRRLNSQLANAFAALLRVQGEKALSRSYFEKSIQLSEKLVQDFPELTYQTDLAFSLNNYANLLVEIKDSAAAKLAFERAIKILEKLIGNDRAQSLSVNLAGTYNNYADLLFNDPAIPRDEVLAWYDKAIGLLDAVLAKTPSFATAKIYMMLVWQHRAEKLVELGRHAEAVKNFSDALRFTPPAKQLYVRLLRAEAVALSSDWAQAENEWKELANQQKGKYDGLVSIAKSLAKLKRSLPPKADPKLGERLANQAQDLVKQALDSCPNPKDQADLRLFLEKDPDLSNLPAVKK